MKHFIISFLFAIVYLQADAQKGDVFTRVPAEIPTAFDVTPSGAFTYSVPLEIPAGILDMMPNLGISYNSQGGNGTLGLGFSMTGLSSITRVNPNIFLDKQMDPVDFDANDVYSLDGQRLIPVFSTISYMTQIKNFAVITASGTSGSGPSYWTVQYPSGLTYTYGNTADSKFMRPGNSDVLVWGINRISDKLGNYVAFTYHNNQTNGQFRVEKITYGSSLTAPALPQNEITFNYFNRVDVNKCYVSESAIGDSSLLNNIVIKHADGSTANAYGFTYSYEAYPHLKQIDQIKNADSALPPIIFNWGKEDINYHVPNEEVVQTSIIADINKGYSCGDFNGDGATDLNIHWGNDLYKYQSNKNNDFTYIHTSTHNLTYASDFLGSGSSLSFDYNGDGYDDMIVCDKSDFSGYGTVRIYVQTANGTGGFNPETCIFEYRNNNTTGSPNPYYAYMDGTRFIPGNFDGDGKTEMLVMIPASLSGTNPTSYDVYIVGDEYPLNSTVNTLTPTSAINFGKYDWIVSIPNPVYNSIKMDYDGDGKDDLLFCRDVTGVKKCTIISVTNDYDATGKPYLAAHVAHSKTLYSGDFGPTAYSSFIYPGDFNGDGKDDVFFWNNSPQFYEVYYSNGCQPTALFGFDQGFNSSAPFSISGTLGPNSNTNEFFVGDFDGDGKSDILNVMVGSYKLWYARAYEQFELQTGTLPANFLGFGTVSAPCGGAKLSVGDFNGDGQLDLMSGNTCSGNPNKVQIVYFKKKDISQLVTSVEHAGKRMDIEYISLAEKGDHYAFKPWNINGHTQTEYPYISKQLPIKVVTSVADNVFLNQRYSYETLSMNVQGLSFQGFKKVWIKDLSSEKLTENLYSYYPWQQTAYSNTISPTPVLVMSAVHLFQYLVDSIYHPYKHSEYSYLNNAGDASGLVRILNLYTTVETDESKGEKKELFLKCNTVGTTSVYYNFGKPDYSTVRTYTHTIGKDLIDTTYYTYDASAPFHLKDKPIGILTASKYGTQPIYKRNVSINYDPASGLILSRYTDPGTSVESFIINGYDAYGNLTLESKHCTGGPTMKKEYTYTPNKRFRQTEITYLGATTFKDSFTYNNWGSQLTHISPNGLITINTYDLVNRIIQTQRPNGSETRHIYDWAYSLNPTGTLHNPTSLFTNYKIITQNQNAAQFAHYIFDNKKQSFEYFDFYKRQIRTATLPFSGSNADCIYEDVIYNDKSLVDQTFSAYPKSDPSKSLVTTFFYDDYGREIKRMGNDQPTLITAYGNNPWFLQTVVSNISAPGNPYRQVWSDGLGVYQVYDNGVMLETEFAPNAKPLQIKVDGRADLTTNFTYYSNGLLKSKDEPNAGLTQFEYNPYGWLTKETDANGSIYNYTYDALGRITEKRQQGASTAYTYTYDNTSNNGSTAQIIKEESPYGTKTEYDYTALAQLKTVTETIPGESPLITRYTYLPLGVVESRVYPSGDAVWFNYNGAGYMESISKTGGTLIYKINAKDHLFNTTSSTFYNGSGTALYQCLESFNLNGKLNSKRITNLNFPATPLRRYNYNWNNNTGNLDSREDVTNPSGSVTENYSYDVMNRLTSVGGLAPVHAVNMQYGTEGNMTWKDDVSSSTLVNKWKHFKYAPMIVPEPSTSTPSFVIPQNTQKLTYYPFEKVKTISEIQDSLAFLYGASDNRVKIDFLDISTAIPVHLKKRIYASGFDQTTTTSSGIVEKNCYITDNGKLVAILNRKTGQPNATYFVGLDHLGSIVQILDNDGTNSTTKGIIEDRSFDAWGRPRNPVNYNYYAPMVAPNWIIDKGYTGHEHMWVRNGYDNSLINMNGRLYDPLIARMLSPDPKVSNPTDPQAYNKYSYVLNNPLKYSDPSGYSPSIGVRIGTRVPTPLPDYTIGQTILYFGVALLGQYVGQSVGAYTLGSLGYFGSAAVSGAAAGFVSSSGSSWSNGATFEQGLNSGLKGGIYGAGSGLVAAGAVYTYHAIFNGMNIATGTHTGLYYNAHGIGKDPVDYGNASLKKYTDLKFPGKMDGYPDGSILHAEEMGATKNTAGMTVPKGGGFYENYH